MSRNVIRGRKAWQEESPAFFEPWEELAAAIVRRAAEDYIEVTRMMWKPGLSAENKKKLLKQKAELEAFFCSDWYAFLCDIPAERLMQRCVMQAKETEKEAIEEKNRMEIEKMLKEAV